MVKRFLLLVVVAVIIGCTIFLQPNAKLSTETQITEPNTLHEKNGIIKSTAMPNANPINTKREKASARIISTKVTNQNSPQPRTITETTQPLSDEPDHLLDIDEKLIDQQVPEPFNYVVKNNLVDDGERARFKKFFTTETRNSWDTAMQNRLYDEIFSHPLGKLISIDSIVCKAEICELRIYEENTNAWKQILADMRTRDWWDFQAFSNYEFAAMVDMQKRNANYVLLGRNL